MKEVFVIILAAGKSTRMGSCKTQLAWKNHQNLLTYQIQQWLWANVDPVVVLGEHNAESQFDDFVLNSAQAKRVINYQAHLGKTTSILAGLAVIPNHYQAVAISAVDQPRDTKIYQQLIEQHLVSQAMITVPTYQGKIGHPLIFAREMYSALMTISEEKMGLRQIMQDFHQQINKVEFLTPDILIDLNTPEQYQRVWECKNISKL